MTKVQGVLQWDDNSSRGDLMSQIFDMILEQLGLLREYLESGRTESCQDFPEDPKVTPGISRVNGGVIQVAQHLRGGDVTESLRDKSGVGGRCIGQAKRHLDELALTKG